MNLRGSVLAAVERGADGRNRLSVGPFGPQLAHSKTSPMELAQLAAHALYAEAEGRRRLEKLLSENCVPELLRRVALCWHPRSLAPLHAFDG